MKLIAGNVAYTLHCYRNKTKILTEYFLLNDLDSALKPVLHFLTNEFFLLTSVIK